MPKTHKHTRKQPRRLTPPLVLTNIDESSDRTAILVDEELILEHTYRSGRMRCYLTLGPGLRIQVGSRCINKRRLTSISIRVAGADPDPEREFPAYRQSAIAMSP